jgi:transposase
MESEVCHGNTKKICKGVQAGSGSAVRSGSAPASRIARDLGIDPNMLSRWCRELGAVGDKAFQGQGKPRDEEMAALKRELAPSQEGTGFFKRSGSAFFVSPQGRGQKPSYAVPPGASDSASLAYRFFRFLR